MQLIHDADDLPFCSDACEACAAEAAAPFVPTLCPHGILGADGCDDCDTARFLLEQEGELKAEGAWLRHAERPDFTDRDFYPQQGGW